jgi:hypothetical protein
LKFEILFNEGYIVNEALYNKASELFKINYNMNVSPEECKIIEEKIFSKYLNYVNEFFGE